MENKIENIDELRAYEVIDQYLPMFKELNERVLISKRILWNIYKPATSKRHRP